MSHSEAVKSDTHYLKLIGKEDFNGVKPLFDGVPSELELAFFRMEAHNLDSQYNYVLRSINATKFDEGEYVEGQLEGNAILCNGSHFSEGNSGELRILLKPENVHRLRFAVSPFRYQNISHFEFYGPSGNVLKRIDAGSGWIDYEVPFQDSENSSIARVSVYFKIYFHSPVVDSFEIWQWEPYQ